MRRVGPRGVIYGRDALNLRAVAGVWGARRGQAGDAGGGAALVAGIACGGAALATSSQFGRGQAFIVRGIDALTARGNALTVSAIALDTVGGVALTAGASRPIVDWLKSGRADRRLALAPPPAGPCRALAWPRRTKPRDRGPRPPF